MTTTATAANVPEYSIETSDVPITSDTFVFTTSSYPFSQARFASGQWESKISPFEHDEDWYPTVRNATVGLPNVGAWRNRQIDATLTLVGWNGGSVSPLFQPNPPRGLPPL